MNSISLTITTKEEKGVLDEITDILSSHGINISYVHLYVKSDVGTLNLELDNVEKLDELIEVPCQHTGIGLNSGSKTMAAEHRKVIVIPLLNIPVAFVTIRTLPKWSRVKYLFLAQ